MADESKIKYSDIIQPDDSVNQLISQLDALSHKYGAMVSTLQQAAAKIASSIKQTSGATAEERMQISALSSAAASLQNAYKNLAIARSDAGKQTEALKAQTQSFSKSVADNSRQLAAAVGSYDKLKYELKDLTRLWRALSDAERADARMGGQLQAEIQALRTQIKDLDAALKPHVETLTAMEKAEQRYIAMLLGEDKELAELKLRMADISTERRRAHAETNAEAEATRKLNFAKSSLNSTLQALKIQTSEENEVARLNAIIANENARSNSAQSNSYNSLQAQLQLAIIQYNHLTEAQLNNVNVGGKQAENIRLLQARLRALEEQTGRTGASSKYFRQQWDGLGFSVSQIVRETPSLAVSLNQWFLAISNNIPILIDQIRRVKIENVALAQTGKPTISVGKQIAKALFSWQTGLILVLAVLAKYGNAIGKWVQQLVYGRDHVESLNKAIKNVSKELKNTNASYGTNVTALNKLSREWKKLTTDTEKTRWIEENQTAFNNLGIAVNSVTDADNIFVNNTDAVIKALRRRAYAEAATKLASDKYVEALQERKKAEDKATKAQDIPEDKRKGSTRIYQPSITGASTTIYVESEYERLEREAEAHRKKAKALEDEAAQYERLTAAEEAEAAAGLADAGIDPLKGKSPSEAKRRDLTSVILQNRIKIQREYEASVTKLTNDEYAKRRKTAVDEVQDENNKLREMLRKNEEYVQNVEGKYKALTEAQKKDIAEQQAWIHKTIANNQEALALSLDKIRQEQWANSEKIKRQGQNRQIRDTAHVWTKGGPSTADVSGEIDVDPRGLALSLKRERELLTNALGYELDLTLATNKRLREEGDKNARSEEEIIAESNQRKLELWAKYDKAILDIYSSRTESRLALVKKGSDEELRLLLEQNEQARDAVLIENAALPAEQQRSSSVIEDLYGKEAAKITADFYLKRQEQQQEADKARFEETEHSETEIRKFAITQEIARWKEQLKWAREGGLEWSDAQIAAAESAIIGLEREYSELDSFIEQLGQKGLTGTLLDKLGFDDKAISAFQNAVNTTVDYLKEIAEAEAEAAEAAVEAARERVEAAQSALDAEIEARNNGYANSVATARKELEDEKKKQAEKTKLLEEAQRRQAAVDSLTQASSLVTATANIWSAFSAGGAPGIALALAAIAGMWTSFAVSKVKAKQLTAQSDEYGEGGLEFLEGGSHASGNDIDLGAKNRRGRRMRAEGGEALAIVNKRNTRKYRKVLPDIVGSLNKGVFEDKYLNAFGQPGVNITVEPRGVADLSRLEEDVRGIRKQNEVRYFSAPNGVTIMQYKNVKRIIKN